MGMCEESKKVGVMVRGRGDVQREACRAVEEGKVGCVLGLGEGGWYDSRTLSCPPAMRAAIRAH